MTSPKTRPAELLLSDAREFWPEVSSNTKIVTTPRTVYYMDGGRRFVLRVKAEGFVAAYDSVTDTLIVYERGERPGSG